MGILGTGGVPTAGVSAVALNVTAVNPSAGGYLTVWPSTAPQPNASNVNFAAGQAVPNLVIVPVGTDGKIKIFNGSPGAVDVIVDVAGYYTSGTPSAAGALGAAHPRPDPGHPGRRRTRRSNRAGAEGDR